jgi:hypothetical protein
MKHITTGENWLFEIKEVRAIKADEYGKPYSATATLRIVNSVAYVENLLSKKPFTKADLEELERYMLSIGFTEYFYISFINGKQREIQKEIRNNNGFSF